MTEGRRALLAVLLRTKQEFVAARCRVTRSAVSKWSSGYQRPSREARRLLALNYGITPSAWDDVEQGSTGSTSG